MSLNVLLGVMAPPPQFLKDLVEYWQHDYDWRKPETALNQFQQFKTEIDGTEIHFTHERGKGKNAQPLLLTHSWPDPFYRYYKVIPMLTDLDRFGGDPDRSFDVIVPSFPGFGGSGHTPLSNDQGARLWARLMTNELGYKKFMPAGGDLGTQVTMSLGRLFPELLTDIYVSEVNIHSSH